MNDWSMITHYEHLVHNAVLAIYAIIAFQFCSAYIKTKRSSITKSKQPISVAFLNNASLSLLLLCCIFILCGATRAFMDFNISNIYTKISNTMLLLVSFFFVITNQIAVIVRATNHE
jgi:hypothetical protein